MALTSLTRGLHSNHGPRNSVSTQPGAFSPYLRYAGGVLVSSSAIMSQPGYVALLLWSSTAGKFPGLILDLPHHYGPAW